MSQQNNHKQMVFINVFLVLQLLIPLTYYTTRSDRNDERFAWRMFSSVRMVQCRTQFLTGPEQKPVQNLHGTFHEAWIELTKRGRISVISAMAQELCDRQQSRPPEVRVQVTCTTVTRDTEQYGSTWNFCRLGSL